jgi:hypothetical protein
VAWGLVRGGVVLVVLAALLRPGLGPGGFARGNWELTAFAREF